MAGLLLGSALADSLTPRKPSGCAPFRSGWGSNLALNTDRSERLLVSTTAVCGPASGYSRKVKLCVSCISALLETEFLTWMNSSKQILQELDKVPSVYVSLPTSILTGRLSVN